MKRTLLISAAAWLALVVPYAAAIEPSLKNGLPCVDDICIGDDMMQLAGLPWQPVAHPATGEPLAGSTVSPATLERMKLVVRGTDAAVEAVAPYWYLRRFDADGLRALAALDAVCGALGFADRLQATTTAPDGMLTEVRFEPVASADSGTQTFRVMEIRRHADHHADPQQLAVLRERITAQYAGLSPFANTTQAGAAWIQDGRGPPHLRLLAPTGDAVDNAFRLRRHPQCLGD